MKGSFSISCYLFDLIVSAVGYVLINGEYEYGEIILLIDCFDKELGDGENGDLAWDILVYEEPTINNIISFVITADGDNICSNNFVQYNNNVWIIIWESN